MECKQNVEYSWCHSCQYINASSCAGVFEHLGSVNEVSCHERMHLNDGDMNVDAAPICEFSVKQCSRKQCKIARIPRKFVRARPLSEEELDRKRVTANIQERRRMQRLNTALERLKQVIPQHLHVKYRRLSKIRTLKLAIDYIAFLNEVLNKDSHCSTNISSQIKVSELKSGSGFIANYDANIKQGIEQCGDLEITDTSVNFVKDAIRYENCGILVQHNLNTAISTLTVSECDELFQHNQNSYFY